MKKEDLIIKWLDNSLDEKELKAFKQLDASSVFIKIDEVAQQFKAPSFDVDQSYQKLKNNKPTTARNHRKRYWIGVAAALVLSLGLYLSLQHTPEKSFFAQNSQKTECNLPDASEVILNAGSQISFQAKNWEDNRYVQLEGEAYFKVARGSKFTVNTAQGAVEVLGTQFTVKSRADFFEVICYEGVVQVNYNNTLTKLTAGNSFNAFGNEYPQGHYSLTGTGLDTYQIVFYKCSLLRSCSGARTPIQCCGSTRRCYRSNSFYRKLYSRKFGNCLAGYHNSP